MSLQVISQRYKPRIKSQHKPQQLQLGADSSPLPSRLTVGLISLVLGAALGWTLASPR